MKPIRLGGPRQPGAIGATLLLIAVAVSVKVVPALAFLLLRLRLREVLGGGVLLSARLSLIIAVAELGARLDLIDGQLQPASSFWHW